MKQRGTEDLQKFRGCDTEMEEEKGLQKKSLCSAALKMHFQKRQCWLFRFLGTATTRVSPFFGLIFQDSITTKQRYTVHARICGGTSVPIP